jgi:hypothetical protein
LQFESLAFRQAVTLEPYVETELRDAIAIGDIGNGMPAVSDLLDRLDLEFLPVTLAAHGASLTLSLRLRDVYWSWGDSQ